MSSDFRKFMKDNLPQTHISSRDYDLDLDIDSLSLESSFMELDSTYSVSSQVSILDHIERILPNETTFRILQVHYLVILIRLCV